MLALTTYVLRSSIRRGLYEISNRIGTCPGFLMRILLMTLAGASARDTSSSVASNTAPGVSAMRSLYVAEPVTMAWAAETGVAPERANSTAMRNSLWSVRGIIWDSFVAGTMFRSPTKRLRLTSVRIKLMPSGIIPDMNESNRRVCRWSGDDPLMRRYHDEEWGAPVHDDRRLFEFLTLEGAQAGLSWS